ncbi:MAG: prolyl oligopeptidase family serine peptidase [Candidatus Eisenbacteria bacterium]|nr:prolyl oligopeptidase family serine peptidase [Candidatus Latescibacterota bacterium]MBD3302089.1 prolyl oligopeptidase family serine peptidase [Candidatus Eisenbacteria bacterium]
MPRPIEAEDLYRIQQPSTCRVSPDGTSVAVVVTQPDRKTLKNRSTIWMVPTDGGKARPFTRSEKSDHTPRFSPDGRTLAFLSSRSGKSEIWTIPVSGGEAEQRTTLEGTVTDLAFSPDGRRIAFTFKPTDEEAREREKMKKRGEPGHESPRVRVIERVFYKLDGAGFLPKGRAHLWVLDLETGRTRQLVSDPRYEEMRPVFSPDGRWIYFSSNRSADPDLDLLRIDIWRVPTRGGEIEKIRTFAGPSDAFSLSPDGRWLAFLGTPDPDAAWGQKHTKLWLVPATGGRPVELTERLDRTCENTTISDTFGIGPTDPPAWSPDGSWIYFAVSNEGNTEIWRVHIGERRPRPVINRPGAIISFDADLARGTLYATFSDAKSPGDLHAYSRRTRPNVRRLSDFNPWLRDRTIREPEEFWFRGKGRARLQGWILRAPRRGAAKAPAILYIHGGPATQYGRVFFHEFQYLAARGYTVLYCNPRGGTGYTERHLASIYNAWGTVDYDDLMAFTDECLRRDRGIDRRRLGVAGGSYGGYMTNWIIGHTNRFAAAITQRSLANLLSFVGSSDFGFAWPREFGGALPWRDPAHYLKLSPILYVDNVRTPTLIEHQEHDDRCPIEQAEQLFAALKIRGIPTEFHRYPDESHGMSRGGRTDRRIERLQRNTDWFDRWLTGDRRKRR